MKAILISIKPRYVTKILNGEKTIEVRKSMPKCDLPIDVYIYCTKSNYFGYISKRYIGKVVAKFTMYGCIKLEHPLVKNWEHQLQFACLTKDEYEKYANGRKTYQWFIDNLEIFDRPKKLSEFKTRHYPQFAGMVKNETHYELVPLTKVPQSWFYVQTDE